MQKWDDDGENYVDWLFNGKIILQKIKNDCQKVYTYQANEIARNSNNDKRLQTFDKITTYPHGTKTCKWDI